MRSGARTVAPTTTRPVRNLGTATPGPFAKRQPQASGRPFHGNEFVRAQDRRRAFHRARIHMS